MSAPSSTTPKKQPLALPFQYQFAAGAIAGITEILTLYPLDVVKTRQQLATGKQVGMMATFKDIVGTEGFGRLYRGLVPPLMLEAPKRALKFAANDAWGKVYTNDGKTPMTQSLSILTGMSAGATESLIVTPFEGVKINLQDKNSKYTGSMDVIRKVTAASGPLGLYKGMEATFWRHVLWNGGYFGCIFSVRGMLPKADSKSEQLFNNFVAGAIGGFIGTTLNTPADVWKSRAQSMPAGQKIGWTFIEIGRIAKNEGVGALYRGFTPKVLRLAPGGGVLLIVVEGVLSMFRTMLGPPYTESA
ncbi:organic acid transporter [Phaffia rhodozyma]|uniref:Organic acid transporter n=1 Tax=Phaffia rhodozyma TaxID=264483 RepID=A0A0F7SQ92_PHARH|nr:organic acid transporter [Phaffia rhodozyma]